MEYLVTSDEMRAYDTYTIEHIGIPAMVLMERAALAVTECVLEALQKKGTGHGRVLCVCGSGNNGGDGLCVARLLADKGIEVDVLLAGSLEHLSRETAQQLSILEKYGIRPLRELPEDGHDVIVDALFGMGLSREITGACRQLIETVNKRDAVRIAIDIPSGIDGNTGAVLGAAVKAEETVALAFGKRGLYLYPGTLYAGKIRIADIGITQRSFPKQPPAMYTRSDALCLPKRRADGNKGTFGKLLLIAGSESMAGAALLSGESAYRTGAGMVKLVIPEKIREIVQSRLPEALIQAYESPKGLQEEEEAQFLENMAWADAIAVGPGLSVCESGRRLLELALSENSKPLVIDADGLNLLASDEGLRKILQKRCRTGEDSVILTPHMGELARLLKKTVAEVTAEETKNVLLAAEEFGCILVGKSARTHVCRMDAPFFLNTAGNAKMATAGSGDVLTGMIAALLAQGEEPLKAAADGVYLHARAGDAAAQKAGQGAMKASDITAGLGLL